MGHLVIWVALVACCLPGGARAASREASAAATTMVIVDFDYVDTSGEERDQRQEHEAWLRTFMAGLRNDLAAADAHLVVLPLCGQTPCTSDSTDFSREELRTAARGVGARWLLVGGFHKMSTLVQWARVEVIDVTTGQAVFSRVFSFRGDSDVSWRQAEPFVVRQITAGLRVASGASAGPPIKLAVFGFELDDFSGGAGVWADASADAVQLDRVTVDVRRLLGESGRYVLVDASSAAEAAARTRDLHHCAGCEAALALTLGADQSFLGVVTRISRTEYTVRYQIRDAHSGTVIETRASDLHIGADYSWNRGAVALLKDGGLPPK
jgi:hypothetical protein